MAEETKKEEEKKEEEKEEKKPASSQPSEKKEEKPVSQDKKVAPEKKEEKKDDKKINDEEKEVEVPKKFKKLVEEIEKMSVLDLAELVKILEKKFGVSAAAPVAAAVATAGGETGADSAEEKSEFNVVLTSIGDKKIEVIKVVRDVTQKGLKEAKDVVDAAAGEPQTIKESVKKEEAEELKKKFETAGAKVELK